MVDKENLKEYIKRVKTDDSADKGFGKHYWVKSYFFNQNMLAGVYHKDLMGEKFTSPGNYRIVLAILMEDLAQIEKLKTKDCRPIRYDIEILQGCIDILVAAILSEAKTDEEYGLMANSLIDEFNIKL